MASSLGPGKEQSTLFEASKQYGHDSEAQEKAARELAQREYVQYQRSQQRLAGLVDMFAYF